MASKWTVQTYENENHIELVNGGTAIRVPFAEGKKLGEMLLKACTSSSKTATSPAKKGGK
jgi:hypothetical protein